MTSQVRFTFSRVPVAGFLLSLALGSTRLAFGEERLTVNQPIRVIFNQDGSEFFVGTFGAVSPKTLDDYVDSLGRSSITDLFINVNYQRTNYRSSVWEADWDGYEPSAGDDQPFFAGIAPERAFEREWIRNGLRFHQQGVDYGKRMLEGCHRNKLKGWISLRMNDSHYPNQPTHPFHSSFWRKHPEWHITSKSLDYGRPEVREHYLALVKEVLKRYDMHGLELDFMRHGFYFREGQEHEGTRLMTAFVREVRLETQSAAKGWGHPVRLAVRVPTRPWIARSRGLDAEAWAKERLIDLVVLAPWWSSTQSDLPIESWKGLLSGTQTLVAACLEDGIDSGAGKRRTLTDAEARGIALSALDRGADAVYLFNFFTGPYQWMDGAYDQFLRDVGSLHALSTKPRVHPITLQDPWAEGEPGSSKALPSTARRHVFRIHSGPAPAPGQRVSLQLGFSDAVNPQKILVNGVACSSSGEIGRRKIFQVPLHAISQGYNLVRVECDPAIEITWVELRVE
jgi:hypothetical protein